MDPENVGMVLEIGKSVCEELRELNQGVAAIVSALGDLVECEKQRNELLDKIFKLTAAESS